ncbi:saccharopine dehydrogenase [Iamia sp. SCSIO 61187]|uniref:saccharopine dehydrogenase family protein n=1 Tax=Iamia sp. SCSIO 61187 TaxID=2722752 RepID=UPI001C62A261|nr:saccharopine dehydrogenase NADP-binding domain-containing protein [Iamia sp. SCSIO 61187]QYG93237.1 saccharopine dehydrogenase [Iamia sp. SCSIO 61187]
MPPPRPDRPLDLVVYGATSFVGKLLTAHLVHRHGSDGPLRWAIAGRSAEKLDRVAQTIRTDVERIVADAADVDALAAMTARTKVVVSTVGPYALYGSELVAAAVAAGTDYCDLTGEPQWMRRMIDAHQAAAEASGARIVHACGFDSIPSDLGVWFTQQQALEALGEPCQRIGMRVTSMRGGASGGTLASMVNVLEEVARDPELRTMLSDPYALAPAGSRPGVVQPEVTRPQVDSLSGQWVAPFVMAMVNSKVVHRSHALLGHPWGEGFRYDEAMAMGSGPLGAVKATGLAAGLAAGMGVAAVGPARAALGRVMPKPGTGPSPKAQAAGSFTIRFHGRTADDRSIETEVTGDRDPGYGSTAKMLGEAAVALVELEAGAVGGGFHTPASALDDDLVARLRAEAGITFSVRD